jgi:hypothetical protein
MASQPNHSASDYKIVLATIVLLIFSLLALSLLCACGRPPDDKASGSTESQNLPFDRQPGSGGILPSRILPSRTKLPEGTPIPVRLQSGLSSASAHAGDTFTAIVDEPVIVDGETVVGRGATTTGRVLEVKASASSHDGSAPGGQDGVQGNSGDGSRDSARDSSRDGSSEPGYLRIVLVSLNVGGKAVTIETSSIFAKGGSREERNTGSGAASDARGTVPDAIDRDKNKDIEFGVDRHLSFRLAQAVDLQ